MEYIERSEEITGYRVKVMSREAFTVVGYTIVVPPRDQTMIRRFWDDVVADGRLEALKAASSVPPWYLGLGSWDPACQKGGQRYTICIEETDHTDFAPLALQHSLFPKDIGASDWMCFEMMRKGPEDDRKFWKANPYKMMGKLGYQFHTGPGYGLGLHFDACPPDYNEDTNPACEFWITVVKS
jgi:predicted transcriptional regulator YdeE